MSQHFKEIMSVYISNTMYKYIITIITQTSIFLKIKQNKKSKSCLFSVLAEGHCFVVAMPM